MVYLWFSTEIIRYFSCHLAYTRHNESIEMKAKASNGDVSYQKENNLGMAMKNGMFIFHGQNGRL